MLEFSSSSTSVRAYERTSIRAHEPRKVFNILTFSIERSLLEERLSIENLIVDNLAKKIVKAAVVAMFRWSPWP